MKQRLILKIMDGPPDIYPWGMRKKAYTSERRHKKQKAWVTKRLLEKARQRLKFIGLEPKDIKFSWCGLCKTTCVICPECGNNTCNAMSPCGRCYHYEQLALETRGGKWPERSEFDADRIEKETEEWFATWTDPDFGFDDGK